MRGALRVPLANKEVDDDERDPHGINRQDTEEDL